jgi:O-6-methylguanine DNA methyltransferase
MSSFANQVYVIVKQIPAGQTLTYQEVARQAGHPGAARVVGNILHRNYNPAIPCHRVIRSDGQPGGYNRGRHAKIQHLRAEGALK